MQVTQHDNLGVWRQIRILFCTIQLCYRLAVQTCDILNDKLFSQLFLVSFYFQIVHNVHNHICQLYILNIFCYL